MSNDEGVVQLIDLAEPSTSKQDPKTSPPQYKWSHDVAEPSTSKQEPITSPLQYQLSDDVAEPSTSKQEPITSPPQYKLSHDVAEPSTSKQEPITSPPQYKLSHDVAEPSTSKQDPKTSPPQYKLSHDFVKPTSKQVPKACPPKYKLSHDVAEQSTSKQVPKTYLPKYKFSHATDLLFSDKLNILIGKRKASSEDNVGTPEKRIRTETISPLASVTSEARRLKIDLIATKAQVAKLETNVNQERTKRMEMQILFEEERGTLRVQHESDERAVSNMEERLQMIKRREQDLMNDYDQEKREHTQYKANWDKQKAVLQKKIADLKDNLLECTASSQRQLSEMRKDMEELLQGLVSSQSEVEILKTELANQTNRAEQCTTLRTKLEKQTFELQSVNMKLKELQYEKDSFGDWQQQAKTAERRLTNMAELEKEVARLRAQEKGLRDCIVNKLLLEEQVHVLETKVKTIQPMQDELHEAKVKVASLEIALEQWKAAARSHGIETADALATTLDTVLNNHLDASIESSEAQLRLTQLTEELETIKFERNKATAKVNELLTIRSHQEGLIDRLQKKQQLISYDRDSYRQLLESYEKELSANQSGQQASESLELLKRRVEQQEQSLQRYRDLLIKHDPTEQTKLVASLHAESGKRREENEHLNREVERLRRHRDALLVHLERIGALS